MSKRSRKESIGDRPDGVPPPSASKRTKAADSSDDALELILGKADELISCIRELKAAKKKHKGPAGLKLEDLEGSTKTNLTTLGQILLPALQGLATATEKESTKKVDAGAITIPSTGTVTKWESREIQPTLLPALPKVLDQTLEIAALTHSGMTGKPTDPSYERLEWIGDAYIYLIASSLVYQTFPKMDPGKCSQAREILIRNSTLAQYSVRYGLDKRANFPEEFGMGGRKGGTAASDKQRVKARGDIFESYVGAIILSDPENGVQRTCDWLKTLWGPELLKDIRKEENAEAVPETQISPKTELERAIVVPGIKIEYRDIPCTKKDKRNNLPLFAVACVLHGWGEENKQLGFGCARGKKEAGQKAAQMALENKKMLKAYRDKKADWLRARAEEEAAAEPANRAQADEEDSSRAQAKE